MNETDSKTIDAIRFPLAIMVVAIHSYITIDGWSYMNVAGQGLGSNMAQFFMIAIGHVLTHIAVPSFFLISGYLFFHNFGDGGIDVWKRKLMSRINTLVIPYVLWILLFILWNCVLGLKTVQQMGLWNWFQSIGGFKSFWCSSTWNIDRVDLWGNPSISSAPVLVPFWFMRNLIVCIAVFSPCYYMLFKRSTHKIIRYLGIVLLSFLYSTQTSLLLPGFSVHTLFFFGFGALLSLQNRSLTDCFLQYRKTFWVLFVALFVVEVILNGHNTIIGNYIYPFYVFTGVVYIVNIVSISSAKWGGAEIYVLYLCFSHFCIAFCKRDFTENSINYSRGYFCK